MTVSIALFVGVFIATGPEEIPSSLSLNNDQGVPNSIVATAPPTYQGRYKAGQPLEGSRGTPAAPVPGGKDSAEQVIKIDVVAPPVTSVAPKTTVVPVPKTTTAAPVVVPFKNCDEAKAAGRINIPSTDPKYQKSLDSDGNGLGCEVRLPKATTAPKTTIAPPPVTVPPVVTSAKCNNIGVAENVQVACNKVLAAVTGIPAVGGYGQRPGNGTSCHPQGLALDFMVYNNKALGDRIFDYVKKNQVELGATPVILWQVADHYDHVHVSFKPCRG
jgi:hypothetical protein